ncbi:MAG: type II secretion system protein GspG [Lentisphaeria bacterium]|nr:type II secretion system protein GspG [Lentisphaeria bacterium]
MKKRFTLVEILAVVAVIAILSVIGVAGYTYAQNSSRESATKALQSRLTAALETVKNKGGSIPVTNAFAEITIDTQNSKFKIGNSEVTGDDAKTFLRTIEVDTLDKHLQGDKLIDAWGNPIYYRYPGQFNKGGIDLVSAGADGKFGADNADTPPTEISKYKDGKELVCDDVVNF